MAIVRESTISTGIPTAAEAIRAEVAEPESWAEQCTETIVRHALEVTASEAPVEPTEPTEPAAPVEGDDEGDRDLITAAGEDARSRRAHEALEP